ncbi:hypothetical protein [Actinomadura sp. BRA 177]|uniref:hypothetical protein n=1 Tax=Actinomadura sp. BRA 177 TaxID=2745202 RepID=UPI0020CF7B10|nr:hypothetical protein [Actinomadura sp. BRA 177]
MTWLTLRQFRAQAAVVFAGLTVTGPGLADDYNSGLASCTAQDDCDGFAARFFSALAIFVVFLPGIIGIFWGAPLIGVFVRRTLPAMAITLAVFVAVQIAVPLLIRPHLVPPVTRTVAIRSDNLGEFMVNGDTMTTRATSRESATSPPTTSGRSSGPRPACSPSSRWA